MLNPLKAAGDAAKSVGDAAKKVAGAAADVAQDVARDPGKAAHGYVEPMRAALQQAIAARSLTPAQHEALTNDEEYDTPEAVAARLQEIHDTLSGAGVPPA